MISTNAAAGAGARNEETTMRKKNYKSKGMKQKNTQNRKKNLYLTKCSLQSNQTPEK